MKRPLWVFLLTTSLACGIAGTAGAVKYPPGPGGACVMNPPDTLTIVDLQDPTRSCHPAPGDTVLGIRGVVTAIDSIPTAFGFFMQNLAGGAYSGIDVFTGATNYQSAVAGTPTGGNIFYGDQVAVDGRSLEFNGLTELTDFDNAQATNDIVIRPVAAHGSPVVLPPYHIGTPLELDWVPAWTSVNGSANQEPWEGCQVKVRGPLRCVRTAGTGVGSRAMLVSVPGGADTMAVDGFALTNVPALAVGSPIDSVQGVLTQVVIGGVPSYRILMRNANDLAVAVPPSLIDAYPLEDNKVRLVFDRALDLATAEDESHYSLASLATVNLATLVGGAGTTVDLDITTSLGDGDAESVTASGIGSSTCPTCVSSPQSLNFVNGVLSVAAIQAPDPARLTVFDDRSRFAGAGTAAGARLAVRAVVVHSYGTLAYIADSAGGLRSGVAVFAPGVSLTTGHRVRIAGQVQEFAGETEITNVSSANVLDEGVATVPAPSLQSIATVSDTSCDQAQNRLTGEDFEGELVRVAVARVVPFNTAPFDPTPGGSFRVVQPFFGAATDTILVASTSYSFDADSGMVLAVAGVLHFTFGSFRILPRGDTDITFLTRIEPGTGGNQGTVSATITGFGLSSGTAARLSRSGQADVAGSGTAVAADGRTLTTTFDLHGCAAGAWDVVVTYPDAHLDTLSQAFTVQPTDAPELRVALIGFPFIRAGRRYPYDLVIVNSGNVDAVDVPVWLAGVPADATLETDFPLDAPPQAGGEPPWSTVPLFFLSPGGRYVPFVIPRIAPGTTVRRVYLTVPATDSSFKLRAAVTPSWADGNVFRSCLGHGGISNTSCMGAQLTAINSYLDATPTIQTLSGIGVWAKIAWQCEGAATLPAALATAEQVLDFMDGPVESPATAVTACGDVLPPRWRDSLTVAIVSSLDPNDKLGPRESLANGQPIPYSIRFENSPSATAPAQQVVVSDPLDLSTLDPTTVTLGAITFGSVRITPPPGLSSFSTQVDMRPYGRPDLVNVNAALDPVSHTLSWYFTSIDPATGLPTLNPLAGFLPPNVTPPQGEGSVLFTVMPKPSLPDATQIRNHASITFDGVTSVTPEWSNPVDASSPTSHVLPLATHSDQPSITVSWISDDSPPDLRDFTIYVSEDGTAPRPWRPNTTATSDTLVPPADHHFHSYGFYSRARDLAGNVEPAHTGVDATTQSRTGVGDATPGLELALEGARPNPSPGPLAVWFTLPSRAPAALELIDVAGRRALRRDVGALGPGRHMVALSTVPPLRPGLYFIRLRQGSHAITARAAVIR